MDFAKGYLISIIVILLIGSLFIISVSYAGNLYGPPSYCHDEKKFKPQKTIFIPVRGWQGSYKREAWQKIFAKVYSNECMMIKPFDYNQNYPDILSLWGLIFQTSWKDAATSLANHVKREVDAYKKEAERPPGKVIIFSHSIGGVISSYAAHQIDVKDVPIEIYTYAAPLAGGIITDEIENSVGGGFFGDVLNILAETTFFIAWPLQQALSPGWWDPFKQTFPKNYFTKPNNNVKVVHIKTVFPDNPYDPHNAGDGALEPSTQNNKVMGGPPQITEIFLPPELKDPETGKVLVPGLGFGHSDFWMLFNPELISGFRKIRLKKVGLINENENSTIIPKCNCKKIEICDGSGDHPLLPVFPHEKVIEIITLKKVYFEPPS